MTRTNLTSKVITNPQIRHIFALARELSLDNENLHSFVYSATKKEHITDLTVDEAISLIDRMKGNMRGFQRFENKKKEPEASKAGMATQAQIKKMYRLMYELKSYDKPGELKASINKRLRGVLKKHHKIDDIRFLTAADAWKVIEELKKMVSNKERKLMK